MLIMFIVSGLGFKKNTQVQMEHRQKQVQHMEE